MGIEMMYGVMASCVGEGLKKLDVSKKTILAYLDCQKNSLSELDLSNNKHLEFLDCSSNFLSALDLSYNKQLEYLDCSFNKLTFLELSHNKKLSMLYCRANDFVELDISKLSKQLRLVDVRDCEKVSKIILPKSKKTAVCIVHDPDFAESQKLNVCIDEGAAIVFEYK